MEEIHKIIADLRSITPPVFVQRVDISILYKLTFYMWTWKPCRPPFLAHLCANVCALWLQRRNIVVLTEIYYEIIFIMALAAGDWVGLFLLPLHNSISL